MSKLIVYGQSKVSGSIRVQGAKNSVLPILAASLNTVGTNVLHNCPELSDVTSAGKILQSLGATVRRENDVLFVCANGAEQSRISSEMMLKMRSSILFLGAMLAKNGKAELCAPGGCDLGPRPIDLHLMALRAMGAEIEEDASGAVFAKTNGRLHGADITFPFVSVGATENALIAAATADGVTWLHNVAREPEIADLVHYLQKCGARISEAGLSNLKIIGVPSLHACEYSIIPDRIVSATYLSAAALTGGKIRLENVEPSHFRPVMQKLEEAGCLFSVAHGMVTMAAPAKLSAMSLIHTEPHPGFPTDAQALLMAVAAVAEGETAFYESVFQNRFRHAEELNRMGAQIRVDGLHARVRGVQGLHGAYVKATDLRGGAAVLIAGLAAEGKTVISDIAHIDRGYERIEQAFGKLGACITRCEEWGSEKVSAVIR